ncbi:hypothetical protein [Oceaniferula spumae]|uniref:hypothetical protein n=1 Tax=Oceaniferula spumae TaxID=2979115 RepID=UPI003F4E5C21
MAEKYDAKSGRLQLAGDRSFRKIETFITLVCGESVLDFSIDVFILILAERRAQPRRVNQICNHSRP